MLAHEADSLVGHHRVVDAQDYIALLQTHLGGRHVLIGLVNHDTIQLLVLADEGADAGILAREHHPEILRLVLSIILRIRVQVPQHRRDAPADGLLRIQRVHVQQLQVLIQLVEDVQMLGHFEIVVFTLLCLSRERQARQQQQQRDISSHVSLY